MHGLEDHTSALTITALRLRHRDAYTQGRLYAGPACAAGLPRPPGGRNHHARGYLCAAAAQRNRSA